MLCEPVHTSFFLSSDPVAAALNTSGLANPPGGKKDQINGGQSQGAPHKNPLADRKKPGLPR